MSKLSELIEEKIERLYDDGYDREYCLEVQKVIEKELEYIIKNTYAIDIFMGKIDGVINFYYPLTEKEIEDKIIDNKLESERQGD